MKTKEKLGRTKHSKSHITSAYISDESPEDGFVVWMTNA